jgi:hypothetical protein
MAMITEVHQGALDAVDALLDDELRQTDQHGRQHEGALPG